MRVAFSLRPVRGLCTRLASVILHLTATFGGIVNFIFKISVCAAYSDFKFGFGLFEKAFDLHT